MAVAGQDGRPGRPVDAAVGDEQVGGDRHGVLGVEDDLVPAVAVAGDGLERLEVEGDRLGLGPEQLARAGPGGAPPRPAAPPGRASGSGSSWVVAASRVIHWYQGE